MKDDLQTRRSPRAGGDPVLFYDCECGLCNRLVRLLLRWDRNEILHFAPLQGPSAQNYLREHGLPTEDFDSLIFVPSWARRNEPAFLLRTDGALAALRSSGRLVWLAAILQRVPQAWRDRLYKVVARVRYRVMGKWVPVPLARAEWRERFLDGSEF